jgi:hypothetical protein
VRDLNNPGIELFGKGIKIPQSGDNNFEKRKKNFDREVKINSIIKNNKNEYLLSVYDVVWE